MTLIEFIQDAVGVPFQNHGRDFGGWDCWGMIVRAYRECFDIELPTFDDISAMNSDEVGKLFLHYSQYWAIVQDAQERPGDVILLRHGRWPCHTGLVAKPGHMLHVDMNVDTCVESYRNGIWKHRVIGVYRHEQLAGD